MSFSVIVNKVKLSIDQKTLIVKIVHYSYVFMHFTIVVLVYKHDKVANNMLTLVSFSQLNSPHIHSGV